MSLFYLIFGCLLGVVFSVTMISGVAWCVQTTVRGGARAGVAAGAAIALAQVFWAGLAAAAVMMLLGRFWQLDWMCRLLSALVLTHFAWQVIQAGPIKTLTYEGPAKRNAAVFGDTLLAALAMPNRLAGYLALLAAMSLQTKTHPWWAVVMLALGVGAGSFLWWLIFIGLAALFGRKVPEEICLKSLNKLKTLAVVVLFGLVLIGVAPLVPGFK